MSNRSILKMVIYILRTNSDLFLYADQQATYLVSGIVRIDGTNDIFYGSDGIYWRVSLEELEDDSYTFQNTEITMNHAPATPNGRAAPTPFGRAPKGGLAGWSMRGYIKSQLKLKAKYREQLNICRLSIS